MHAILEQWFPDELDGQRWTWVGVLGDMEREDVRSRLTLRTAPLRTTISVSIGLARWEDRVALCVEDMAAELYCAYRARTHPCVSCLRSSTVYGSNLRKRVSVSSTIHHRTPILRHLRSLRPNVHPLTHSPLISRPIHLPLKRLLPIQSFSHPLDLTGFCLLALPHQRRPGCSKQDGAGELVEERIYPRSETSWCGSGSWWRWLAVGVSVGGDGEGGAVGVVGRLGRRVSLGEWG